MNALPEKPAPTTASNASTPDLPAKIAKPSLLRRLRPLILLLVLGITVDLIINQFADTLHLLRQWTSNTAPG